MLSQLLMLLSGFFLSITLVLYLLRVSGRFEKMDFAPSLTAIFSWVILGGALMARGVSLGMAPFVSMGGALVFTTWVLIAIYLHLEKRYRMATIGVFVWTLATTSVIVEIAFGAKNHQLPLSLTSPWSTVHIAACLVGYASLALAFGTALGYMLQEHMLKTKRFSRVQTHLPALDVMDVLSYRMVTAGLFFLSIGLVTGAFWAMSAWHRIWDPKLGWALITWLVYAAYLHMRGIRGWRGKWSNRLLVIGFACVVVTFLGVNFLPKGLHNCLR